MCLQQANSVRVITKALLANLRSNNDCGLSVPLFKNEKKEDGSLMSRGTNQKLKFTYLMKIMQKKRDDEHSLTMLQIMNIKVMNLMNIKKILAIVRKEE